MLCVPHTSRVRVATAHNIRRRAANLSQGDAVLQRACPGVFSSAVGNIRTQDADLVQSVVPFQLCQMDYELFAKPGMQDVGGHIYTDRQTYGSVLPP